MFLFLDEIQRFVEKKQTERKMTEGNSNFFFIHHIVSIIQLFPLITNAFSNQILVGCYLCMRSDCTMYTNNFI